MMMLLQHLYVDVDDVDVVPTPCVAIDMIVVSTPCADNVGMVEVTTLYVDDDDDDVPALLC